MAVGVLWLLRMPATSAPWDLDLGAIATLVPPRGYLVDFLPAMLLGVRSPDRELGAAEAIAAAGETTSRLPTC